MDESLSELEMQRWVEWKQATDAVWSAVVDEISKSTDLSAADFSVLTRVVEEGGGLMRQQRLANELGWDRSRLSRQLERMEQRGLVTRPGDRAERLVEITARGAALSRTARHAHARAVRHHLLGPIPRATALAFWRTVQALGNND